MIALFLASWAWAEQRTVESSPRTVVVFADRARITRSVSVPLPAGEHSIVFDELPASTFEAGLTADARGGTLRGIDFRRIPAVLASDARIVELDIELKTVRAEHQRWVDNRSASQTGLEMIAVGRSQSSTALSAQLLYGSKAPMLTSSLKTTLSDQETTIRAEIREANQQIQQLDRRLAALERERSDLGNGGTDRLQAIVHIDVERASTIELDLSYLVSGASWVPHYDLRGDADSGKISLELSAEVSQTTGEDWNDVQLTVSSARPNLGTQIPTLDPFWLQRPYYEIQTREMSRSTKAVAAAPMMAAMEPEEAPMDIAQASVNLELAATTFTVSRPEDIHSDGTQRKVLLTTEQMEAVLEYQVVPRLDPRAYLVGKIKNTADFPLLSGVAGVFLDGAYLGDMMLQTVPAGEEFEASFGIDDRVSVRRTPKMIEEGRRALVGKKATSRWSWDITVKNGHAHPIHLHIQESLPLSTRADVEVKMEPSPSIEPKQDDNGILRFIVDLQSRAETKLHWGYQVTYPVDLSLGWME